LIAQLSKLQKQFQAGDFSSSLQTRDFLKQWLSDHIQGSDQKYGVFLQQKEIQ
jgi:hemerythrin